VNIFGNLLRASLPTSGARRRQLACSTIQDLEIVLSLHTCRHFASSRRIALRAQSEFTTSLLTSALFS
jgi:hypothetical protein